MEDEYINRVLIYLKQELPDLQDWLELKNGKVIISVPAGQAFPPFYEKVFNSVTAATTRIRKREKDIDFTVRSPVQERDFKILS